MHDGTLYDPIQGQDYKPLKVGKWKSFHLQMLFPPPFIMGAGN